MVDGGVDITLGRHLLSTRSSVCYAGSVGVDSCSPLSYDIGGPAAGEQALLCDRSSDQCHWNDSSTACLEQITVLWRLSLGLGEYPTAAQQGSGSPGIAFGPCNHGP